jgi:hypothetical protein
LLIGRSFPDVRRAIEDSAGQICRKHLRQAGKEAEGLELFGCPGGIKPAMGQNDTKVAPPPSKGGEKEQNSEKNEKKWLKYIISIANYFNNTYNAYDHFTLKNRGLG